MNTASLMARSSRTASACVLTFVVIVWLSPSEATACEPCQHKSKSCTVGTDICGSGTVQGFGCEDPTWRWYRDCGAAARRLDYGRVCEYYGGSSAYGLLCKFEPAICIDRYRDLGDPVAADVPDGCTCDNGYEPQAGILCPLDEQYIDHCGNQTDDDADGVVDERCTVSDGCRKCGRCEGDPVDLLTGQMYVGPRQDATVSAPAPGLPGIDVVRFYDSVRDRIESGAYAAHVAGGGPHVESAVLGPGWRHEYEQYLTLETRYPCGNAVCSPEVVTWHGPSQSSRFFASEIAPNTTVFKAAPGTTGQLMRHEKSYELVSSDGVRRVFRPVAVASYGTTMHPWGCTTCVIGDDPSTQEVNTARLEAIWAPPPAAFYLDLVYEDELATSHTLCATIVDSGSSCDAARGLLAQIRMVWVDHQLGSSYVGNGVNLRYTSFAAGTGAEQEWVLRQVRASSSGTLLARYEYTTDDNASSRPAKLARVYDRFCSDLGCLREALTYSPTGNTFDALVTVEEPVALTMGGNELRTVESFTWSNDQVVAHESPGTSLAYISSTGTSVTWMRNGVSETTVFDAYGNPLSCDSGACGTEREWQMSSDAPSVALGTAAQLTEDGRWILREHTEAGLVELELVIDYSQNTPPTISKTVSNGIVTYDVTSGALVLTATRTYYNAAGRPWVIARHSEHQALGHDGKVRFPEQPSGCETPSTSDKNWFYCGSLSDRTSTYHVSGSFAYGTSGTQHVDVTVYDYGGGSDANLNGGDDGTELVRSEVSVLPDLQTSRLVTITTLDAYGRPMSVSSGGRATMFAYLSPDATLTDAEDAGRLDTVTIGGLLSWDACSTNAYDEQGAARCFYRQDGAEVVITRTHSGGPSGWLQENSIASGALVHEEGSLSSGFPVMRRVRNGIAYSNETRYRMAPLVTGESEATIGARPTVTSEWTSASGTQSEISRRELQHNAYGFLLEDRLYDSSNTLSAKTVYDYSSSSADPNPTSARRYRTTTDYVETTYTYTAWDAVDSMIEPDGTYVDYVYWAVGETGASGGIGKVKEIRRSADGVSWDTVQAFTYDASGRLATTGPGLSGYADSAQYEYDTRGRVVLETMPAAGRVVTYEYNALGDLTMKEVSSSLDSTVVSTIDYVYDTAGRLIGAGGSSIVAGNGPAVAGDVAYHYDSKGAFVGEYYTATLQLTDDNQDGRLAYAEDLYGYTFYEYDDVGRVTAVVRHDGLGSYNLSNATATLYAYGATGELVTMTYPSGREVTYGYAGDMARPTSVQVDLDPSVGQVVSVLTGATYDATGALSGWDWGNTSVRTVTRDMLGRVTHISDTYGTGGTTEVYYRDGSLPGYDEDGDLLHEEDSSSQYSWVVSSGASAAAYDYDTTRDILSDWTSVSGSSIEVTYAADGRRDVEYEGTTYAYAYDYWSASGPGWQRLVVKDDPLYTSDEAVRLFYTTNLTALDDGADQAGQVTGIDYGFDGTVDVELAYGPQGNVISALTSAGSWGYEYDYEIRRVRKDGPSAQDVVFRYGARDEPLEEYETVGTGYRKTEFIFFNGERVAVVVEEDAPSSAAVFYLHTDRMGVIRKVTKPDGTPVARVMISPWGDAEIVQDAPGTRPSLQHIYLGQYEDPETALVENRYRSIIPRLGAYSSPEPLHAWTSSRFSGPHGYTYAAFRPLYFIDPDGLRLDKAPGGGLILPPSNLRIPALGPGGPRSPGAGAPKSPTTPAPSRPKAPKPDAQPRSPAGPSGAPVAIPIPCGPAYTCEDYFQAMLDDCDDREPELTENEYLDCLEAAYEWYQKNCT